MSHSCEVKKKHKKLIKVGKNIENDFGVKLSSKPTNFVLLSNAGLVNAGSTSLIMKELPPLENHHYDIVLFPNKTYAVVRCPSTNSASKVVETLNGSSLLSFLNGQPVYAGFLDDDIPNPKLRFGPLPPGLAILENVILPEEEQSWLDCCSFDDESSSSSLKNRQVEHFGYCFDYAINGVHRNMPLVDKPIPLVCVKFLKELMAKGLLAEADFPDQLTVNRYYEGAGIPAHCDTHSMFTSCIVVVSLGASVVMDFCRDDQKVSVFLPRGSLTLMQDESRYAWTHGIATRKYDLVPDAAHAPQAIAREPRTSFTFRRVRSQTSCECKFPSLCDSRLKFNLDDYNASQLEKQHVHEVYENIANHFSNTRHSQWPRVTEFLASLPKWSCVADVGCGNGKYMRIESRNDLTFFGCDRSVGLLDICRRKSLQATQADCLALPFRQGVFDAVICIAVIHHLSTASRRKQAIQQMSNLLKENGKLLIYVWSQDQKISGESKYLKEGRRANAQQRATICAGNTEITLPIHTNRSAFSDSDVLVPWKKVETHETQQRYYHVFKKGELKLLVDNLPELVVLDDYYDEGNWCLILQKKRRLSQ